MSSQALEVLRFPIGHFVRPANFTAEILSKYISDIDTFPASIRLETAHLTQEQLDTTYREGGWTIRQVVHHCADSHMNSLIRFKLALTEDKPVIKPYFEERWAELADSKSLPIGASLQLLDGLHARWAALLKSLTEEDLSKTFIHPEKGAEVRLDENMGIYAWHCNHHLAHITNLKIRKGWK